MTGCGGMAPCDPDGGTGVAKEPPGPKEADIGCCGVAVVTGTGGC